MISHQSNTYAGSCPPWLCQAGNAVYVLYVPVLYEREYCTAVRPNRPHGSMRPTSLVCLCLLGVLYLKNNKYILVAGLGQGLRRGRAWTKETRRTYKLAAQDCCGSAASCSVPVLLKGYSKSCWTPRLRLSHSGQDKHAWNEVQPVLCCQVEHL
jgi:hypothetical protein